MARSLPASMPGFLGNATILLFGSDPNSSSFALPELELPRNVDLERLTRRRGLLEFVDAQLVVEASVAGGCGMDEFQQHALGILAAPGLKQATGHFARATMAARCLWSTRRTCNLACSRDVD